MTRTIVMLLACLVAAPAMADDWTQFRGPNRDGHSAELGLLDKWPDGGPKLLWTVSDLGKGYSSASIADGKVYVTGLTGADGTLFCFDTKGALQWKKVYGKEFAGRSFRPGRPGRFPGARTTPTVHDGKLYLLSGMGRVCCFDAKTGKQLWAFDALKRFGGRNITWGISECLLIEDGKLIVTPGGPDASVVALDPATGKTLWKSEGLSHTSAYCSPVVVEHAKTRMILTMTGNAIVGIAPKDGKVLWQHPYRNFRGIHPVTPIYKDGYVFATSGYGHGGVIIKLDDAGTSAKEVWREKIMDTHHGGLILIGDHVYGTSSTRPKSKWMCVEVKTGKVLYEEKGVGKGAVIAAGGKLYCYGESGTVALAQASPKGFGKISSFEITAGEGEHWAHPSIANGVLYIRHGSKMMAYDIKASK